MNSLEAPTLIAELRRRGARVTAPGGRLLITAPRGLLTEELKQVLREKETELLNEIQRGSQHPVLAMALSVYAREGFPIHLEVPGLPDTIWFVPTEAGARQLVTEGVRRGRIWTAAELQELMRQPGLTTEDAITMARVRLAFDATVVESQPEDPPESEADVSACRACCEIRFWRSTYGEVVCGRCHPPADEALVLEWIEAGS